LLGGRIKCRGGGGGAVGGGVGREKKNPPPDMGGGGGKTGGGGQWVFVWGGKNRSFRKKKNQRAWGPGGAGFRISFAPKTGGAGPDGGGIIKILIVFFSPWGGAGR